MRSWRGHLIIGAVGWLALLRSLQLTQHLPVVAHVPPEAIAVGLVVGSAYLALVPDSDEPGSFISRRVRGTFTILGGLLSLTVVLLYRLPLLTVVPIVLAGTFVGMAAGALLVRSIRRAAGGHRRLTHSLVSMLVLVILAVVLVIVKLGAWALVPAVLAWGGLLHVLGDLPTPAGVPLLYPFSKQRVGLPRPIATYGEPLAVAVAGAVGALLLLAWV